MNRASTSKGSLVRLGFRDAEAALPSLAGLGSAAEPLLAVAVGLALPEEDA